MKSFMAVSHGRVLLVFATSILTFVARPGFAQSPSSVHVGLAGGTAFSTGESQELWRTGYQITGLLKFDGASPFGGRLDFSFSRSSSAGTAPRISSATRDVFLVFADATVAARSGVLRPYALAGGGLFIVSARANAYDPFGQIPPYTIHVQQSAFGWNVGGGVSLPLSTRPALFLEVRYTHAPGTGRDPIIEASTSLVQLVAGITF
jgi:opacity protein-like surface antigen